MPARSILSAGLSSSRGSVAGVSSTSNSARTFTSVLLSSILSRATRLAGWVASRKAVMKEMSSPGVAPSTMVR